MGSVVRGLRMPFRVNACTTLMMSTWRTFGSISALYGLNRGIIHQAQYSILVTEVILAAIAPTIAAQRWFSPGKAKAMMQDSLERVGETSPEGGA